MADRIALGVGERWAMTVRAAGPSLFLGEKRMQQTKTKSYECHENDKCLLNIFLFAVIFKKKK